MSLNKPVAEINHDEPRYHLMRAALNLFDKPLAELNDQQYAQVQQQAYRELAIEQTALNAVEASGVIIPAATVEASMRKMISEFESEQDFWQALENNQLSREQLFKSIERDLRVQAVIERVTASAWRANDVTGEIFYHLHKARFEVAETRTLRHILLTINEDYAENTREQALNRINAIRERVVAKPQRFDEQAKKHSECPTAMHGGLLGQVSKGQLYAELEAVAFALGQGEISGPVESELGLHLVYCEAINPPGAVAYHEVKHKIKDQLQQRLNRIWLRQWLKAAAGRK